MNRRRKGRSINGILLLDKGKGISSNFALQQCKRLFQAAKAGHTGSLDPLATGVLPLCFGEATKFSQYLLNADKAYKARIRLGEKSVTGDAEGEIIEKKSASHVTQQAVLDVVLSFVGNIQQVPPMYSALKRDGQPLYKLARQGIVVDREARGVTINGIDLIKYDTTDTVEIEILVSCSKGTYIRTLAEDIAESLGTVGHLTALERTEVGDFTLAQSLTFEQLQAVIDSSGFEGLDQQLISPEEAVNHLPLVELHAGEGYYVRLGQAIFVPNAPLEGLVRIKEGEGDFIGIGEMLDDGRMAPKRLVAQNVEKTN